MQLWLRVITVFAMLWRHRKKRSRSTRNSQEVAQAKRVSTEKVTVKFHFQVDWVCSHCCARLCEHLLGKSVWASSERFKWGREAYPDCRWPPPVAHGPCLFLLFCLCIRKHFLGGQFILFSVFLSILQTRPYQNSQSLRMYLFAQKRRHCRYV